MWLQTLGREMVALAEQTMAHTFDTKANKLVEATFRRKSLVAKGEVHFRIRAPSVLLAGMPAPGRAVGLVA